MFVVVEPTWNFAALSESSPVVFRVPNRERAVIHLSGRSANVHDRECSYELSPLTRWTIGGAAADNDVPPAPIFGLNSPGQGLCEVTGVGFHDLTNTRSISAGSLTLHFWNELAPATSITLAEAVSERHDHDSAFRATAVRYRYDIADRSGVGQHRRDFRGSTGSCRTARRFGHRSDIA